MQDEINPYAPPKSDISVNPLATAVELPSASMGARFLNLVIDSAVRWALAYGIVFVIVSAGAAPTLRGLTWPYGLAVMWIYYVSFESLFGFTIGKLITGTRVVARDGKRASFGQIVGRSFSRLVPFDPLSFLGSNPNGGWHDRWSGTRVVRVR